MQRQHTTKRHKLGDPKLLETPKILISWAPNHQRYWVNFIEKPRIWTSHQGDPKTIYPLTYVGNQLAYRATFTCVCNHLRYIYTQLYIYTHNYMLSVLLMAMYPWTPRFFQSFLVRPTLPLCKGSHQASGRISRGTAERRWRWNWAAGVWNVGFQSKHMKSVAAHIPIGSMDGIFTYILGWLFG